MLVVRAVALQLLFRMLNPFPTSTKLRILCRGPRALVHCPGGAPLITSSITSAARPDAGNNQHCAWYGGADSASAAEQTLSLGIDQCNFASATGDHHGVGSGLQK